MNSGDPSDPQPDLLQPPPATAPAVDLSVTVEDLQQQAQDLRTLFNATFVALIVLALGLNFFLFKQMRMAHQQLNEQRPVMQRAEVEFRKRDPEFKRFITALQQYAVGHPDFVPLLARYRGALPQYFPGQAVLSGKPDPGATVPAPATNPPGK
jgi:hypothetical protein